MGWLPTRHSDRQTMDLTELRVLSMIAIVNWKISQMSQVTRFENISWFIGIRECCSISCYVLIDSSDKCLVFSHWFYFVFFLLYSWNSWVKPNFRSKFCRRSVENRCTFFGVMRPSKWFCQFEKASAYILKITPPIGLKYFNEHNLLHLI